MTSPASPQTGTFDYNGIIHTSWWHDQYQGAEGANARAALAGTGASWAAVLLTWYMPDRNSPRIAPDAQRTPSDAAVLEAIRHLHGLGLKVMLKPHVDPQDDTWRGTILPPDSASWFESYSVYMTKMARLAEAEHVELLCIGTELARLTGSAYRPQWQRIIADVRANYRGLLTYAANGNTPGDEFSSMSFVDLIDLAGIDAYPPLTDKDGPARSELVSAWSRNNRGDNMLAAYRNWQRSHGKPVIFTEIGYRSANGTNRAPWDYQSAASADVQEQADCYDAAFSAFLPERAWMKGMFWWNWDVPPPATGDTGFSPWTKPADEVLKTRFSAR
jgi:hypothetical protein